MRYARYGPPKGSRYALWPRAQSWLELRYALCVMGEMEAVYLNCKREQSLPFF